MRVLRLVTLFTLLFGYTFVLAQNKLHCKETGFYKTPLKICFPSCVKKILEDQCSQTLKGFNGQVEFKLVISIPQEKVLNTQLFIHDKNEPLSPKQRISIKKALKNIPLLFLGKEKNERQALPNFYYKTSWVYSVVDGHFKNL